MARRTLLLVALLVTTAVSALAAGDVDDRKLDPSLRARAHTGPGHSRVIIQTVDGQGSDGLIRRLRGRAGRRLASVQGQVADVPDSALEALAADPRVRAIGLDRPVRGTMERTGAAVGAAWVRE